MKVIPSSTARWISRRLSSSDIFFGFVLRVAAQADGG